MKKRQPKFNEYLSLVKGDLPPRKPPFVQEEMFQ